MAVMRFPIPAGTGFLSDKSVILGDTIKETVV